MSLRHAVLGQLAAAPRSGYELEKAFAEGLSGAWSAGFGQIYPELSRLLAAGLVEVESPGPRGRRRYSVTPSGRAELRRWLRDLPKPPTKDEALLRVFSLWLLEPSAAREFLEHEAERHSEAAAAPDLPEPRTPAEWWQRIAVEARVRSHRARADWAAWAIERLDEESLRRATS
jgi:DNA-binding PadR family transcriptional regulator